MNVIPVFNENDAILSAMPLLVRLCPARAPPPPPPPGCCCRNNHPRP